MSASIEPAVKPDATRIESGFIIGPVCDSIFIIGAPLLSVLIVIPLFSLPESFFNFPIRGTVRDARQVFIASFIAAHLVLVYFRSHANAEIFRLHPLRFTLAPAALLAATALSPWVMGVTGAIAIWWDVYHSSLQTFGFGRIYDAKRRNGATVGRNLDYWMNLVLYAGPVLAGAHFMKHVYLSRDQFLFLRADDSSIGKLLLEQSPVFLDRNQWYLTSMVLCIGIPLVLYYLFSYYRLSQLGYRVSWQKIWLLTITGTVSICVWGFSTFLDAFFVMNFFHSLQYFTIVWHTENKNLCRIFRVDGFSFGKWLVLIWIVVFCLLYGFWAGYHVTGVWGAGLAMTTAIMHFWYDGFIWSVRKRQI